jgi:hypothetical protein
MARDEVDVLDDVENEDQNDVEGTGEEATDSTASDSAEGEQAPSEQASEKPEGPSAEEIQQALESFLTLADGVVEGRDTATGELPASEIVKVKTEYAKLPVTAAKTKARNGLNERMKNALAKDLDAGKARAYMTLEAEVKTTGATREAVAKAPVDPTEAFVERVTAVYLATSMFEVPEGVDESWARKVQELGKALEGEVASYKEYLRSLAYWNAKDENGRGDAPVEPEVSSVVKTAARVAHGRGMGSTGTRRAKADGTKASASTSTYTGPRRSVKAHIQSAFNDKPAGTFLKISEIAGHTSNEYGDDHPSSGAVSAALFPSSGKTVTDLEGIEPAEQGGVKGARKVS